MKDDISLGNTASDDAKHPPSTPSGMVTMVSPNPASYELTERVIATLVEYGWIPEDASVHCQHLIGGQIAAALSLEDEGLWPLIQRLERGCWSRKWSEVKAARKAIESQIGKRPHDPFWRTDAAKPK